MLTLDLTPGRYMADGEGTTVSQEEGKFSWHFN